MSTDLRHDALRGIAIDEHAKAMRWRNHAIDSDEELAMAMDVLREFELDHRWHAILCNCPLCVRARVLLGGGA